jgi:phosphoglycerate dehydrogenase-like enzyme
MIRVVVNSSIIDDVQKLLVERDSADVELLGIDDNAVGAAVADADAAIRWDFDDAAFHAILDQAPRLRWLHSPGAGVENWPLEELAARKITLTNAAGVFAIPIAEWVLTTMLNAVKHTDAVRAAQREHRWVSDIPAEELYGRTLAVLGTGGIGSEVITRARGFGMRIWGSNRSGRPTEGVERVVPGDAWRELLPDADFVVSTLPLTRETRGMIGAAELKTFKPGAWLLNVGRGATIDEDALLDALRNGQLGGAALDAWTTEPLPADHPAWSTANVVVSPHISGASAVGRVRGLTLFADNVRRFANAQPLTNVVDLSVGY